MQPSTTLHVATQDLPVEKGPGPRTADDVHQLQSPQAHAADTVPPTPPTSSPRAVRELPIDVPIVPLAPGVPLACGLFVRFDPCMVPARLEAAEHPKGFLGDRAAWMQSPACSRSQALAMTASVCILA